MVTATHTRHQDDQRWPVLNACQDFRIGIARNDLERARQLGSTGASNDELLLMVGALTSSLYNVLQLVDDLTQVEP